MLHETSCVKTPQQNSPVEWQKRHLLNVARALRFQNTYLFNFMGNVILQLHI